MCASLTVPGEPQSERVVARLLAGQVHDKDIALRVEVDDPELAVVADPRRLRQILINLGTNAIRATARGTVSLEARAVDAASISITSIWLPFAISTQFSQTPQGSVVGPPCPSVPTQFMPLAMIRAVVVLPVPRMPVIMKAWAIRSASKAFFSVRTIAS